MGNYGQGIGGVIGIAIAVVVIAVLAIRQRKVSGASKKALLGAGSVTIGGIQVFAMFKELDVKWMDPLKSLTGLFSIFKFDIDLLKPSCFLSVQSQLSKYAVSLSFLPFCVVISLVFQQGLVFISGRLVTMAQRKNAIGQLCLMAFLPMSLLALGPLRCHPNPSAPETLMNYRSVECWQEGDHDAMLALGALAVLVYVFGYLAVALHASWSFSSQITKPTCDTFLVQYGFLFGRFKVNAHKFALVALARSTALALSPVLFPGNTPAQLLLAALVLQVYAAIQCKWQPWHTDSVNMMDTAASVGLGLAAMAGACVMKTPAGQSEDAAAFALWVAVLLTLGVSLSCFAYQAYFLIMQPKTFAFFLSHHKGGAGVQARLLKDDLAGVCMGKDFLDSDELDALDQIYKVVAEHSEVFVLMETDATYTRMWCALEMVAAMRHNIPTIILKCGGEQTMALTDSFIDKDLDHVWLPEQVAELAVHGCSLDDVRDAYRQIRQKTVVIFNPLGGAADREAAIQEVLRMSKFGVASSLNKSFSVCTGRMSLQLQVQPQAQPPAEEEANGADSSAAQILIAGNTDTAEGFSTCRLLSKRLQVQLGKPARVVTNAAQVRTSRASYLVVTLTPGLLEGASIAGILNAAVEKDMEMVPVMASKEFAIPNSEFYTNIQSGKIVFLNAEQEGLNGTQIVSLYKRLFNVLALDFSPMGSSAVLITQITALSKRFRFDGEVASAKVNKGGTPGTPIISPKAPPKVEVAEMITTPKAPAPPKVDVADPKVEPAEQAPHAREVDQNAKADHDKSVDREISV